MKRREFITFVGFHKSFVDHCLQGQNATADCIELQKCSTYPEDVFNKAENSTNKLLCIEISQSLLLCRSSSFETSGIRL